MDNDFPIVGTVMTVVAFLIFVAIVWWAYSSKSKKRFEQAEQAPFALPDTADGVISSDHSTKQQTD